jgi:hypothetical protein
MCPAPDFSSSSKKNPPAVERGAFHEDELLEFLSRSLFTRRIQSVVATL